MVYITLSWSSLASGAKNRVRILKPCSSIIHLITLENYAHAAPSLVSLFDQKTLTDFRTMYISINDP